ncbi:hypothetical protein [Streptomyces gilvus]|uniref:hypothetical protein n=1 Tax=Streptomyces gilvus TaxID=2920937 RepID=UPI001F0FA343|nr:hypothetical protein [Streptomyces sp. CME 23]MCH5675593.1 hypothetical protein [Streptomyces sp. CME 23]
MEHNAAEQERIGHEIAALQDELTKLRRDHTLLLNMQQALESESAMSGSPSTSASDHGSVSAEKVKNAPASHSKRQEAEEERADRGRSKTERNTVHEKNRGTPSLRELVFAQLSQRQESRSAAEVTTELTELHSDRTLSVTLVRNALESLVAKGQVQRNKQQRNVFYSTL